MTSELASPERVEDPLLEEEASNIALRRGAQVDDRGSTKTKLLTGTGNVLEEPERKQKASNSDPSSSSSLSSFGVGARERSRRV